ncbi:TetR/AcrR family transcriptional regulator [Microterricola viridarii]|uniref:Regulatory protein, tetR family n=1 Tax=Microterricola viridarii TaxID=412690 RepID=A0A1H1VC71_9MICO|nr:TetR/AcrR family transcriptional regulator [Microterricola viridarii]SDS82355.1 regulatory protein, tetR family [Microterricola viridarii]
MGTEESPQPETEPVSQRRRGPYAATAARRADLARAALASFAEHGHERASLRDIAARADMTHAALLRHFSGKDELLLAALTQHEQDEEDLAARIAESRLPAEKILSTVLREEFSEADYQRNWMALVVAATNPTHPAHEFFMGRRERMRTRFTGTVLTTSRDSASISADEKVTLALAMMDGLRIQVLMDPTRDVLAVLEVFMKLIASPEEHGHSTTPTEK